MPITISLTPVKWMLGLIVLILTLLGLASEILLTVYQEDWAYGLVPLLNFSYETNIPTWYSAVLLMACAGLLGGITFAKFGQREPFRHHWAALALILAFFSLNQVVHFHEVMNPALSDTYHLDGLFAFSWVIPFGILTTLFAVAFFGFFHHLPHRFKVWFAVAGALYVGGTLVTELAISLWYVGNGGGNLTYGLLNLAQGSFAIAGTTVFFVALLAFVSAEVGEIRITLLDQASARRPRSTKAVPQISLEDKLKTRYLLRYEPN